jgi:YesN/AraC family two-component response regulator
MDTVQPPASFSLLLVEDDSLVCKSIGRMISKEFPGIRVFTAENGRIGLDVFKEHTPEIVITDINMPDMDGIEMASEIKKLKSDTKFIVLTGYSDRARFERFREIGFEEYMIKPVDFEILFAAIEKCRVGIPR